MNIDDLTRFQVPGRPHLHPDGVRVVFEVARLNIEDDRTERSIWIHDGTGARPFTSGLADGSPRWSPTGDRLAFLRGDPTGKGASQVAVIPADGGEAAVLTDLPLGVTALRWSPDGSRLAVVGKTWTHEWADLDDDERARRPRRITGSGYRHDNQGWLHDRRAQVWIVDAQTGVRSRAGERDGNESAPVWSADGTRLAFLAEVDDPRRMTRGVDIVEVALAEGIHTTRHPAGGWLALSYGPDEDLYAVGDERPDSYPGIASLWRLDANGPTDLTGHLDRSIWSFLLPPEMADPVWLDDGRFLIGLEDGGRVGVVAVGNAVEERIGGERFVLGFDAPADGSRIVFVATDPTNPGELFEIVGGEERPLTNLNAGFRDATELVAPHHRTVATAAAVEVDVWSFIPPGTAEVPVLLNIHGGPASQYGFSFFDEFQIYVDAGYGVIAANPRGSSGRGDAWVKAVTGDGWGVVDQHDVLAVLEAELAREPRFDADRIGIMGGSYGGFLTAWITGRDHRFASAVVERALLNWESFSGTSDIARDFAENYLGVSSPEDHAVVRAAGPLATAHLIRTPTLILHSEKDFRCPIEQAEQLFMALLRSGTEVEFIRFPDEGHELSRSGTPRHRAERFEAILEWHARFLKP
jgi:dipeptidyl aminopeptidase/acylaminoacyl peptidase